MAAGTASLIGGGLGLLTGGIQAIDGANRQRRANNELNDYERQSLDNAFENIQISTMGSDLLREQGAQTSANMVDALQNGGSRAIIGGLPRVAQYTNEIDRQAAKLLDDQYNRRSYAIAGDNARIEGMTENRDNQNIAALSSQANAGRQDMWGGIMGAASGLGYAARNYQPGANPEVKAIDTTGAPGFTPTEPMPITTGPYMFNTPYNSY